MRAADDTLIFVPADAPTEADVRWVVGRVCRRLEAFGLVGQAVDDDRGADPLGEESVALAGLSQAAVLGRAALGQRTGRGPLRVGGDPDAPWVERQVPLHAEERGFDLHAAVTVAARDRGRLAQLCRYLCRPPLGQHRLQRLRDGPVALVVQRPWADGTTHLVFTPSELLARLVPLVPRPRINLLVYHGVLAPKAPWRRAVVARDGTDGSGEAAVAAEADGPTRSGEPNPARRSRYRSWAELMQRAFEADVLACPRCGGRITVLATIDDPAVIRRILTHLGLSTKPGEPALGRAPPEGDEPSA